MNALKTMAAATACPCENAVLSGDEPTCTCTDGSYGDGAICTEWSDCPINTYESSSPSTNDDRICTELTEMWNRGMDF